MIPVRPAGGDVDDPRPTPTATHGAQGEVIALCTWATVAQRRSGALAPLDEPSTVVLPSTSCPVD